MSQFGSARADGPFYREIPRNSGLTWLFLEREAPLAMHCIHESLTLTGIHWMLGDPWGTS